MKLTANQLQRIQESIEKQMTKTHSFRWNIRFEGGQWLVSDLSGTTICQFPEIPTKADLVSMVAWGTATAKENMGSLWRSQLEFLANVVVPEAFREFQDTGWERIRQAQQMQQ